MMGVDGCRRQPPRLFLSLFKVITIDSIGVDQNPSSFQRKHSQDYFYYMASRRKLTPSETGINPKILEWARLKSGYSIEEISAKLGVKTSIVVDWESGDYSPTYRQLEDLAIRYFKRPVALFFYPEPPNLDDVSKSFRTLPESELEQLIPDTRYAFREGQALQIGLAELNEGKFSVENPVFNQIQFDPSFDLVDVCGKVREILGISIDDQIKFKDSETAFRNWRKAITASGIFVFTRPFKQEDLSGFCLPDAINPIIYVNSSNSSNRKIFTLIHELGHILMGEAGVTKRSDEYINRLEAREQQIEVFCNRFASEFLLPTGRFQEYVEADTDFYSEQDISRIARSYNVSREVVLRRALDRELIGNADYEKKREEWFQYSIEVKEELKLKRKSKTGGPSHYQVKASQLGKEYLGLVYSKYYSGRIGVEQLADYLGVKPSMALVMAP